MTYVEKTLASRPTEAALGGVPSVQNKIRAFLNVKYQKQGQWTNPALEVRSIITSTSVHRADMFETTTKTDRQHYSRLGENLLPPSFGTCCRSFSVRNRERSSYSKTRERFRFIPQSMARISRSSVCRLSLRLLAWPRSLTSNVFLITSSLPKLLRDRFLSEYNQRIRYLTSTSDPYKHALYKLIGRVELSRRNVVGVTQTTEDWLWFQLSLVREDDGGVGEASYEKYGLRELQGVLVKFGEGHFDPKGVRPLLYFQVLLLSGQFERVSLSYVRFLRFKRR